jgi:hypothetical protein
MRYWFIQHIGMRWDLVGQDPHMNADEVIRYLLKIVDQRSQNRLPEREALYALLACPDARVVETEVKPRVLRWLAEADVDVVDLPVRIVREQGWWEALPLIQPLLEHPDQVVRTAAEQTWQAAQHAGVVGLQAVPE